MSVHPISAVLADVDGTLVTKNKVLTERAIQAVNRLRERGVVFTICSGRPPRGMRMLVEPLRLTMPMAAFNGGVIVLPDLSVLDERALPDYVVPAIVEAIEAHGLDVWIYSATTGTSRSRQAARVDREASTTQSEPTVVATFDGVLTGVVKIVGVSDDHDRVATCEAELQRCVRHADLRRAVAAVLPRCDPPHRQQGHRHRAAGAISEDPRGGHRDDRRPAERRADVRAERPERRDGQCDRGRAAAGHPRRRVPRGRGVCRRRGPVHPPASQDGRAAMC